MWVSGCCTRWRGRGTCSGTGRRRCAGSTPSSGSTAPRTAPTYARSLAEAANAGHTFTSVADRLDMAEAALARSRLHRLRSSHMMYTLDGFDPGSSSMRARGAGLRVRFSSLLGAPHQAVSVQRRVLRTDSGGGVSDSPALIHE